MPIYRVPEMASSLNFHSRNSHQPLDDGLRHHHQQQQQQQQHHHHQDQSHFDHLHPHQSQRHSGRPHPDEVSVRRSQSMPTRMTDSRNISSAAGGLSDPADESIVEREIRLQLEKEAEIASLHRELLSGRTRRSPDGTSSIQSGFPDGPEVGEAKGDGLRVPSRADRDFGGNSADDDDDSQTVGEYSRVGESLIVKELMEQKKREEELRNHYRNIGMIKEKAENGKAASGGRTPPGAHSGSARQAPRVQPFEEPEEEDEVDFRQVYIKPQMETVIEREVRLLRQREGSLRRVRGYPLPPREEHLTEVEQRQTRHPPATHGPRGHQSGETGDGVNLKRLATNRLKQEMLKERQREIDLRKQGKIYTISEERVGLDPHLTDTMAMDETAARNSKRQTTSGVVSSTAELAIHARSPVGGGPGNPQSPRSNNLADGRQSEGGMPPWRTSAELRIEAEVREARRREKELREQRRLANAVVLTNPQQIQSSDGRNRLENRQT